MSLYDTHAPSSSASLFVVVYNVQTSRLEPLGHLWEMPESVHDKTNNLGSDQAQHKRDCTVTEDG